MDNSYKIEGEIKPFFYYVGDPRDIESWKYFTGVYGDDLKFGRLEAMPFKVHRDGKIELRDPLVTYLEQWDYYTDYDCSRVAKAIASEIEYSGLVFQGRYAKTSEGNFVVDWLTSGYIGRGAWKYERWLLYGR